MQNNIVDCGHIKVLTENFYHNQKIYYLHNKKYRIADQMYLCTLLTNFKRKNLKLYKYQTQSVDSKNFY